MRGVVLAAEGRTGPTPPVTMRMPVSPLHRFFAQPHTLLCMVVWLSLFSPAGWTHAATLSLGAPAASAEGVLDIPVLFQPGPGEAVSSLQFDLRFDAAAQTWLELVPGHSSTSSGKMVSTNALGKGRHRVIVAGFNKNQLPEGALATVRFQMRASQPGLTIESPILSDPEGRAVRVAVLGLPTVEAGLPGAIPAAPKGCACGREEHAGVSGGDFLLVAGMGLGLLAARTREARQRRAAAGSRQYS